MKLARLLAARSPRLRLALALERLAHNLDDLPRIVIGLTERGVHIVFVKEMSNSL
jgi:DNA invertase Pin-like site-specific DNA recombinase